MRGRRRPGAEWRAAMQDIRRLGSGRTYGALLPLNEPHPLFALSLQQGPVLDDGDSRGAFSQPPFRRALDFYAGLFRDDLAPRMAATQVANVWDEFARGLFAFYVTGPWNIGEFRRRLPAERQGDWATAPLPGPDGPGVSTAGGSSLVIFKGSRAKGSRLEADQLPERARDDAALPRPHRRPAAAAQRLEIPALANDPPSQAFAQQLERVRAAPKIPEWERIFQEMQLTAERVVQGRQGAEAACRQLDAWVDALLEKRRWLREQAGMTKHGAAAWILAGPALLVIAVFFALPVVAGLALSLTDFDIYALADLSTLRFVGLQNYLQLLQTPLFWQALGNTLYFVVVGVPVSIGLSLAAALLLDSRFARWQPLLPHRRCSRPWSRPSSPWPSSGATCCTRATASSTRASRRSAWRRSTGSATRTGRCRRSSSSPPGRTSATT